MLRHGYEPGMGLGKNNDSMANLVDIKENRGKFRLGYKPTRTDVRRSIVERRSRGAGPQLRPQAREVPPCDISKSFMSAGLRHEEQVTVIYDEVPQELSDWCGHAFLIFNWETGKSWNDPKFPWWAQCNALVLTLQLGLGFRVLSLLRCYVFCY